MVTARDALGRRAARRHAARHFRARLYASAIEPIAQGSTRAVAFVDVVWSQKREGRPRAPLGGRRSRGRRRGVRELRSAAQ
jgi:hypothetical protein